MLKPQLFGLHFSGGNVYSLQNLFAGLKDTMNVELLELPGRGKRFNEELLDNRDAAVADLLSQIQSRRTGAPYVLYGHSMGAELGFIICHEMELRNDPPLCFIPTGNAGPNVHKREKIAELDREAFFAKLKEMGGMTNEILENEELLDYFEPILRADFKLLEDAEEVLIDYKINTPVMAVMGDEEKYVSEIRNWKAYTEGSFDHKVVSGDHFFIYKYGDMLLQLVQNSFLSGVNRSN